MNYLRFNNCLSCCSLQFCSLEAEALYVLHPAGVHLVADSGCSTLQVANYASITRCAK